MATVRNFHGANVGAEQKIRLVKALDVTDLSGEKVMIDFETGKYFLLKGPANEIWDMLVGNEALSCNEIVDQLMEIFDVDRETCMESVTSFVKKMEEYQFVTIE